MKQPKEEITFHDLSPEKEIFLNDVCDGLSKPQKTLPCKYFYNEVGSRLFNAICRTVEYYPTRTELGIMKTYAGEMADMLKPGCLFIEYGSGIGEKVRLLLEHLKELSGYVPIDISKEHLKEAAEDLNRDYPDLEVLAVCADFTKEFSIPAPQKNVTQKVIYFPGSTIGNFHKEAACHLLENMANSLESGDGLLIGIDLKKNEEILIQAYNDNSSFTEAFNRNILLRINKELDGDFQLDWFDHEAFYEESKGCVEMHLVSRREHKVTIHGQTFQFLKGESIHTESSHKYTIDEFSALAKQANFNLKKSWIDENDFFGVLYLEVI